MKKILCYLFCTALALKNDKGGEVAVKSTPARQTSGQRKEDSDETDLSSSTDSSDSEADTKSSDDKKSKSQAQKKTRKIGKKNARYAQSDTVVCLSLDCKSKIRLNYV